MKVGLVSPYSFAHPGGVQNHILGLAGWLLAQGHEPAILAPGAVPPDILTRRGLAPAQVTSLGSAVAVPWNGSVARIAGGPRTRWRVRRWLAGAGLDVLHLHEPITPSASLWALRESHVPTVATFHCATPRSRLLALAGKVLGGTLGRLDIALAVSDTAARVVTSHLGLRPDVVPNGIHAGDFGGARGSFSPPLIVFLGRLTEPRKGLSTLLAAVPRLATLAGEFELAVAGPGERTLPPTVRALGPVTDAERSNLLRNADVLVAPNTGRESFGLILVEAMAAGASVVASDLPAFADVLTSPDGRRMGRTFPVGDAEALARAVAATLRDPGPTPGELRAYAASFDWSQVGPRILEAYARARRTHALNCR